MEIKFTKMHGIGNDYIYVNCMENELPDPTGVAIEMSPRHFSVGSDGLILICNSNKADAKMRMFNADGSEGKMCGNGIRCVGKYLYDKGIVKKTEISVETLGGIKYLSLNVENGVTKSVRVDMGEAILTPSLIPVALSGERAVEVPIEVDGNSYVITCVSMGNPHAVIFTDDVDGLDLEKVGPHLEFNPIFPERVNTEFVKLLGKNRIRMRVWERGSGETFACGTGACASVVASALCGVCDFDTPITVELVGGELSIVCTHDLHVYMTGTATTVYEGIYQYEKG